MIYYWSLTLHQPMQYLLALVALGLYVGLVREIDQEVRGS